MILRRGENIKKNHAGIVGSPNREMRQKTERSGTVHSKVVITKISHLLAEKII
jgi:hypothetical protein